MGDVTGELILITGASGFIGRATVNAALARGHRVVAVHRRAMPQWKNVPNLTLHRADLSSQACVAPLRDALQGVTAVIHTAAHMGAGTAEHETDTLAPTRHVLDALEGHSATRVLVSSISVYDHDQLQDGAALTEASALQVKDQTRDAYSSAKLAQENLFQNEDHPAWIMRPGAVWGKGRTWHALNGPQFGKLFVTVTSDGELPLTHVTQTADALVRAAETPVSQTTYVNVFDDDRPTRQAFVATHKSTAGWPRLTKDVSWPTWQKLCRLSTPWSGRPGLLHEPIAKARLMPLTFPNTLLRSLLGGQDTASFQDMMRQSFGGQDA